MHEIGNKSEQKPNKKRKHKLKVVRQMIAIFCHGKHHLRLAGKELCPNCQQLADYAEERVRYCPNMREKEFCDFCKIHCYAPEQRKAIREVMRYAGPRMLLHAPLLVIRHMWLRARERWKHK